MPQGVKIEYCPVCESTDVTQEDTDIDDCAYTVFMKCNQCYSKWEQTYFAGEYYVTYNPEEDDNSIKEEDDE